jgi:hypothetical protein
MARLSLLQQISELKRIANPDRRYSDLALRLAVFDKVDGRLQQIGESRVYGGQWDNWAQAYTKAEPTEIIEVPCSRLQLAFIEATEKKRLVYAGRGGGKSHGGAIAMLVAGLELPHGTAQVVSPTYPLSSLLWDKILQDLPTGRWLRPDGGVQIARRRIVLRNGFTLRFGSADRERSLRGGDADIVFVDERQDVSQRAVDIVTYQLRKRGGYRLLQIGTPDVGSDFHEEFERYRRDENCYTQHFTSFGNPFIPHDVFTDSQAHVDPRVYRQEVLGEWLALGGVVYEFYNRETHGQRFRESQRHIRGVFANKLGLRPGIHDEDVGDDITQQVCRSRFGRDGVANVVGLDFNVSPMVAVVYRLFQAPPGVPDIAWLIDEVILEDRADATRMGRELTQRGYPAKNTLIIADASGAYDGRKSSFRMLQELNYRVLRPGRSKRNPEVEDRVNSVNAKMRNAAEQVTWLIDPERAPRTMRAIQRQQRGPNGKPDKDGGHDHYTDAMGYPIVRIYPAAISAVRSVQGRYAGQSA